MVSPIGKKLFPTDVIIVSNFNKPKYYGAYSIQEDLICLVRYNQPPSMKTFGGKYLAIPPRPNKSAYQFQIPFTFFTG